MVDHDDYEKSRHRFGIFKYQYEYMDEMGYNMSKVLRQALDDRMIQDGADLEQWREMHG